MKTNTRYIEMQKAKARTTAKTWITGTSNATMDALKMAKLSADIDKIESNIELAKTESERQNAELELAKKKSELEQTKVWTKRFTMPSVLNTDILKLKNKNTDEQRTQTAITNVTSRLVQEWASGLDIKSALEAVNSDIKVDVKWNTVTVYDKDVLNDDSIFEINIKK